MRKGVVIRGRVVCGNENNIWFVSVGDMVVEYVYCKRVKGRVIFKF